MINEIKSRLRLLEKNVLSAKLCLEEKTELTREILFTNIDTDISELRRLITILDKNLQR